MDIALRKLNINLFTILTSFSGNRVEHSQILFGVNSTVSCLIPKTIYDSLTLDATTCTGIKSSLQSLPFSNAFNFNSAFGIFGNPHVEKTDDWISSSNTIDFAGISSLYVDNHCQTMTSIQVMIYYSYVVSEESKQYYILRMSQQPIYKNVTPPTPSNFYFLTSISVHEKRRISLQLRYQV